MDTIRTAAKLTPRVEIRSLRVTNGYALGVYEDGKLYDAACAVDGPRDAERCVLSGFIWHQIYASARRLRYDHKRAGTLNGRLA